MPETERLDLNELFKARVKLDAELALRDVLERAKTDRTGGIFALTPFRAKPFAFPLTEIGQINTGREEKYRRFCGNKIDAVEKMVMEECCFLDVRSQSSWTARDEDKEIAGGGFYCLPGMSVGLLGCKSHTAAFSGLTPHEDEAVTLRALVGLGLLSDKKSHALAAVSDNGFYSDAIWPPRSPALMTWGKAFDDVMPEMTMECRCGEEHQLRIGSNHMHANHFVPVLLPCGTTCDIYFPS